MTEKTKNRVLIVSGFFPFPSFFGGAFDVYERIMGIKALGYEVDLICTYKDMPDKAHIDYIKSLVGELFMVKRKNSIIDLLSSKPLQVVSRKELRKVDLRRHYSMAILESESVGLISENKKFKAGKTFVRIHNNESKYFLQLANSTNNFFSKLYYFQDSLKFRYYSPKLFSVANRLWFISKDEMLNSKDRYFERSIHLPPPINSKFSTQSLDSKNVLFIGSFFMPNNIQGLDWYLDNIHHRLEGQIDYKLIIAGGTGNLPESYFTSKYSKYSSIEMHFNVESLDELYKQSSVFINPMLHGTGVKLKSINAIVNGLPLVSTKIGAEGIGLIDKTMYLNADNPSDFYIAINKLLESSISENQTMVNSAQIFLQENNYLAILKNELQNIDE